MPTGPCMMEGCDQPGVLRCPVCKAEGVSFRICSQECLDRGWSAHKKKHQETHCMAPGCEKPGIKRCPVCKQKGNQFKICSQSCLDRIWDEHKKIHDIASCQAPGCSNPGVKRCPVCQKNRVSFKVCSQACLDKIWPQHKKLHEAQTEKCSNPSCDNSGHKRCPVCKAAGVTFKICSQACLDELWPRHKTMHKESPCQAGNGCSKPGVKRCPMCKQQGRVFKVCSQECLDKCWPTHKKQHMARSEGSGSARVDAPSSPIIRPPTHRQESAAVRVVGESQGGSGEGGAGDVYGEGKGAMASLASAGEQELETYRQVVRMATMENVLTSSKLKMLADMRQQLHISEQQHHKVLKDLYIGKDEWQEMKDKGRDDAGAPSVASAAFKECVVCCDANADHVVLDCMHMCLCSTCAQQFRPGNSKCPLCRGNVRQIKKIFV